MADSIVTIDNVSWAYARTTTWALKNLCIDIMQGDFVAVMGENGAGKTTFCRLLNGLIPHSMDGKLLGTVTVDGILTISSTVAQIAGTVGTAFDDPESQLFTATVYDEVAFALENLLFPPQEIRDRVRWALDTAGLSAYTDRAPSTLSGGQKQRLAIAAAIALAEKMLVLDEPCSQLDPAGAQEVLSLVLELRARRGLTVVMATNSGDEAAEFADKICVLENGRLAAFDTPRRIFADEQLSANGAIPIPHVSEFARRMAARGEPLPQFPVNLDEAAKSVVDWYASR